LRERLLLLSITVCVRVGVIVTCETWDDRVA